MPLLQVSQGFLLEQSTVEVLKNTQEKRPENSSSGIVAICTKRSLGVSLGGILELESVVNPDEPFMMAAFLVGQAWLSQCNPIASYCQISWKGILKITFLKCHGTYWDVLLVLSKWI